MQCTECPCKVPGCEKEFKATEWWDMRKHYRAFHPDVNPTPLFTKESRTERLFDPIELQKLHGTVIEIKDNGGNVCGKGTLAYNPGSKDLTITGCKIRGRAL